MVWGLAAIGFVMLGGFTTPRESLGHGDIEAVVNERKPEVRRACFAPLLTKEHAEIHARVTAEIRIDKRGFVISSKARGGDALPMLAPCVARELARWRFPVSDDTTTVSIPFRFVEPKTPTP